MSGIEKKLQDIEIRYTEQGQALDLLDCVVVRQAAEILQLREDLQWLKQQYLALKEHSSGKERVDETPPHY